MENTTLRILDIVPGTSVDGPGLRTSIYFAGCAHRCEGCHNPQSWDMLGGQEMTINEILAVVEENGFNVTFSGGDPIYQIQNLIPLATELNQRGYSIWCYTGFHFEELFDMAGIERLLPLLDVVVDGPFSNALRDTSLRFRGSSNQRLIDVSQSTRENIVIWSDDY